MSEDTGFRVTVERIEGFEFRVAFDWEDAPEMRMDEPEPLGSRQGPNATRVLAAAVANCLSASLLFCLQKSRVEPRGIRTVGEGRLARNTNGRLRVEGLDVRIDLDGLDDEHSRRVLRCTELFEDFCVVTSSVREGIPIHVAVHADGEPVYSTQD